MNVKMNKELSNNRIVQTSLNLKVYSLEGPLFLGHTEQTVCAILTQTFGVPLSTVASF